MIYKDRSLLLGGRFRIEARVPMQSGRDTRLAQAEALAKGVSGTARALDKLRSDLVVVLGDRVEALAGALAASTTNRVLAHIHGGDVAPGHLDDAFRHSITKLAHLHFAATPDAGRRLIRLGEWPEHVYVVGAPGLDDLRAIPVARISHYHIDDARRDKPALQQTDPDRVMPGDGAIDLAAEIEVLRDKGYDGTVSLELFNRELWERDPAEVVRLGIERLREIIE